MGTKVIRVTFSDDVQMFGKYSTVSDLAIPEIQCVGELDLPYIESGEMLPGDLDLMIDSDVLEEIVQCVVLHYGELGESTAWISTAKRLGDVGILTGARCGEEYKGDVIDEAVQMNSGRKSEAKHFRPSLWNRIQRVFD